MDEGGKVYGSEGEGRMEEGEEWCTGSGSEGEGRMEEGEEWCTGEERGMRKWNGKIKTNSDAFVKVPPESALVHTYYILTTYLLHTYSYLLHTYYILTTYLLHTYYMYVA